MILVVWGHCLQNLTTDSDYWTNDRVSEIIISFHMPLFMMISGYFACSSLQRPFVAVIKKKVLQLLLPSIIWGLFVGFLAMFLHRDFSTARLAYLAENTLYSYWFLKSLFMCYLIMMTGELVCRKWRGWGQTIFITLLLLAAESLNYSSTISMLPFFYTGLLLKKHDNVVFVNQNLYLIVSACVYTICMIIWRSGDYNLYLHPFVWDMGGVFSILVRSVTGISGSLVVIFLIRYLYQKIALTKIWNPLGYVGTRTLGIYLLQVILAEGVFKMFGKHVDMFVESLPVWSWTLIYDFVITPIAACLVITFSVFIITIIRMSKYCNLILLGER